MQIIPRKESLIPYESFNTLWVYASTAAKILKNGQIFIHEKQKEGGRPSIISLQGSKSINVGDGKTLSKQLLKLVKLLFYNFLPPHQSSCSQL
jgi:hypothetical protein